MNGSIATGVFISSDCSPTMKGSQLIKSIRIFKSLEALDFNSNTKHFSLLTAIPTIGQLIATDCKTLGSYFKGLQEAFQK